MSMKISTRQVDGVTIVDCSGRITLGEGSVTLRDLVRDLLSKGQKKILLNLGDVNYIDSSGIGELVSAFTTVRNPAKLLTNDEVSPLFLAVIEATEEAIYNSLLKAVTVTSNGRTVQALPIDRTVEILKRHGMLSQ